MRERSRALGALIVTALLWSSGGVVIKWVPWNALAVCGVRGAIAALSIWLVLRRPRFDWSAAQIGGAVAYAATVLLYVSSLKLTTVANAILLQYTSPVWVALFSTWFLKEPASRLDWLCVALCIVGMILFFRQGLASQSLLGDALATASGLTIAWVSLFLRKQKSGSPAESILLGNILAAIVGLPFAVGSSPGLPGWAGLLFLGTLQTGLSYWLYSRAIKHVTAMEAILFSTLEPILSPVWVLLLLGEKPGPWAIAGGAMVLLALLSRGLLSSGPTLSRRRA